MAIRYPYAVFLSLFLCLLFLTRFFNYNPWQHPHAWTPQLLHVEKALVVVTKSQETSLWVEDVDPSWRKYTYLITQDTLNSDSNITLSVPVNKGNEAMRYLSFIIDHYHNLPNIIVFRHGHNDAWHQRADAATEINYLNLTTVRERGYQNFRCTLHDGLHDHECPVEKNGHREDNTTSYWETVEPELASAFEALWGAWFGGTRPEYLMAPCCAQFAVTGEAVRRRPREKYVEYRRWLIETELEDYFSGRVFERSWHVVFGMPPVSCGDEEECNCQIYTGPLGCGGASESR